MKYELKATRQLLIDDLALSLYYDYGKCFWELLKNGIVAHMLDPDVWEPNIVHLEVMLAKKHPLTGGPALVVLDHGCGMTDNALMRYFGYLGTPESELKKRANGSHKGAAQKGIGRLAALALNKNCRSQVPGVEHGYFVLSRTSSSGNIRYIHVRPEEWTNGGIEVDNFLPSDATEVKFLEGVKTSFTAIVIPTPVFETAEEIYESVKWLLPREKDKMFRLTVNGRTVEPPPLETEVTATSLDGAYRARIGSANPRNDGIWLCDASTGIRVASCVRLAAYLPDPLGYPSLSGDIFAPGLLESQNTSRDSLRDTFMKRDNKEWQRFLMFLLRDVVPLVNNLVERDAIEGDMSKMLGEIVDMFNDHFGPPDKPPGGPTSPPGPVVPPRTPGSGGGGKGTGTPRGPRLVTIKVKNKTYRLFYNTPLGLTTFAQPNPQDSSMIMVNARGPYEAMPPNRFAAREHCIMQILIAIGGVEKKQVSEAMKFANEIRAEFKKPKR